MRKFFGFTWRNFLKAVAMLAGVVALGFICVMLWVVFSEWDQVYKSRIARARADMAVFQFAIDLYAMKYGHPPQVLSDLAPGPGHLPGDACFLPRGQFLSPWNTPYHLEIEHNPDGNKIKLWTVPDEKTRERLHLSKFTNDTFAWTNPWPGRAALASASVKAGIACDGLINRQ
jgi:hypothetical protein